MPKNIIDDYCCWILKSVPYLMMALPCWYVMVKLSMMQTENLLQVGATTIGVFLALSALLYGRATLDLSHQEAKRYAVQAAEECMKGSLVIIVYFGLSTIVFFLLSESYAPAKGTDPFKSYMLVPLLTSAALCVSFALPACVKLRSAIHLTVESWELLTAPTEGDASQASAN